MKEPEKDFAALDYNDFAELYLESEVEGVLSQRSSELDEKNTNEANKWATNIFNDIRRWMDRQIKTIAKNGGKSDGFVDHNRKSADHKVYGFGNYRVQLKIYRIGSYANQEVPIVDVIITPRQRIEINIYDSESVMIKLTPVLAKKLGEKPKSVVSLDRVESIVTKILKVVAI